MKMKNSTKRRYNGKKNACNWLSISSEDQTSAKLTVIVPTKETDTTASRMAPLVKSVTPESRNFLCSALESGNNHTSERGASCSKLNHRIDLYKYENGANVQARRWSS